MCGRQLAGNFQNDAQGGGCELTDITFFLCFPSNFSRTLIIHQFDPLTDLESFTSLAIMSTLSVSIVIG